MSENENQTFMTADVTADVTADAPATVPTNADLNLNIAPDAVVSPVRMAVMSIERDIADEGWGQSPSLFALVKTKRILPLLQAGMDEKSQIELRSALEESPDHLTAVLQDQLPQAELEDILAQIVFGEDIEGVALAMERYVVSPQALEGAPEDPEEQKQYLLNHPTRQDVRIIIGVTRDGQNWCATRAKNADSPNQVGQGPDLVPELIQALSATLVSQEEFNLTSD